MAYCTIFNEKFDSRSEQIWEVRGGVANLSWISSDRWQLWVFSFHTHLGPFPSGDDIFLFSDNLATSELTRSASSGRSSRFDPPFDAPGSELFSALRINILRHVWKPLIHFFWKWNQNVTTKCLRTDCTEGRNDVRGGPKTWAQLEFLGGGRQLSYSPYSGSFLGLCGLILLKIRTFRLVFRNEAPQPHRFVVQQ